MFHNSQTYFDQKLTKRSDGCWIWTGSLTLAGHGQYRDKVKQTTCLVHRSMWEIANGPLPKGKRLRRLCTSPACCNPTHLTLMDSTTHHRAWKETSTMVRGSSHHNTHLKEEDVRVIRLALGRGVAQKAVAKQFKVSQATISAIKRGKVWGWLAENDKDAG